MTDPISLFATIGAQLKVAADMAVGLSKLHTSTEVDAKAIELQRVILSLLGDAVSAQAQQSAMVHRISDLEEEIRRVKAWEETKQRYALHEPRQGTFVYALKAQSGATEPPHWICAHCYEDGKRSILQFKEERFGDTYHFFPICKTDFVTKDVPYSPVIA
jgi:hypothetical protein